MLTDEGGLMSGLLKAFPASSGNPPMYVSWDGSGGGIMFCCASLPKRSPSKSQSLKLSRKPKMLSASDAEKSSEEGGTAGGSGKSVGSKAN